MAGAFDITTTTTELKLPPARTGQLVFTVTNTSGRQLTVRGMIVTLQSPDQKNWFNIVGGVERPCPPAVSLQYVVSVAVPSSAPAGPVTARFDALAKEDPDAYQAHGPAVVVDIPAVVVPPVRKPFPWWIVAVVLLALLVLGGGGYAAYRLINNHAAPVAKASPTPPRPSPTPLYPPGFSAGTWVNLVTTSSDPGPRNLVIQVNGTVVTAKPTYTVCYTKAPFWCDISGMSSGPATYDPSRQAFVFTWTDGSHMIQAIATFTPDHHMVLVMTWDGSFSTTYTLNLQGCAPFCLVQPTGIARQ